MLRGRVTEIVPGDHVTVLLMGGELKRVPWLEVDRVVVGNGPAGGVSGGGAVPSPTTATPPAPPPMVGPTVRVHLKGTGVLHLYRRPAGTSDFVKACESPCDIDVPVGDTYKVGGSGVTTTKEFRIDPVASGKFVEITVDGPNYFGIAGGGLLTLAGGISAYVGILLALAGTGGGDSSSAREVRNVGLGALLVGGGLIAVGLLIVFPSIRTDLSQDTKTMNARRDGFLRSPTWRTTETTAPSNATFPIMFERSF